VEMGTASRRQTVESRQPHPMTASPLLSQYPNFWGAHRRRRKGNCSLCHSRNQFYFIFRFWVGGWPGKRSRKGGVGPTAPCFPISPFPSISRPVPFTLLVSEITVIPFSSHVVTNTSIITCPFPSYHPQSDSGPPWRVVAMKFFNN
jgi:hypothetical protein